MNEKLISNQPPLSTGNSYSETPPLSTGSSCNEIPLKFEPDNIGASPHGKVGWICPICGRALSPDTICCPFCWGHNNQPACIIYGTGEYVNPNCSTSISSTTVDKSQNAHMGLKGKIQ